MRALVNALLALLLLATPALAQPRTPHRQPPPPNLAGVWGFETAPEPTWGCVISGRAQVRATSRRGEYDVRMQAVQRCEREYREEVRTEQTCIGRYLAGGQFFLDCRLNEAPEDYEYLPDNFHLTVRSNTLMEGRLISGWIANASWRRDGDSYTS